MVAVAHESPVPEQHTLGAQEATWLAAQQWFSVMMLL